MHLNLQEDKFDYRHQIMSSLEGTIYLFKCSPSSVRQKMRFNSLQNRLSEKKVQNFSRMNFLNNAIKKVLLI